MWILCKGLVGQVQWYVDTLLRFTVGQVQWYVDTLPRFI